MDRCFSMFLLPALFLTLTLSSLESQEPRTYVVGVEDLDYYPYYTFRDGRLEGYVNDLFSAFANLYGYNFSFRALPVPRLYAELFEGAIDFKFPGNSDWNTAAKEWKQVFYSSPVVECIDGVMVLTDRQGEGIEELKLLGIVRGFTPVGFEELIGSGQVALYRNNSFPGLLNQVLQGHVDGAYINPVVAVNQLANVMGKAGELIFDPALPYAKTAYHISSIKHRVIIKQFDEFLSQQFDLVESLKDKYGLNALPE